MAVIRDTDLIIPAHRAGAIKDAMMYASVPCEVTTPARPVQRGRAWPARRSAPPRRYSVTRGPACG